MIHKNNVKIITSKSNHLVPKVDNIELHSTYDPQKEASALKLKYVEKIKNNKFILVLGLGFAYHVDQILTELKKYHQNHYKILIIEQNSAVYHLFLKNFPGKFTNSNVDIIHGQKIKILYRNVTFLNLLAKHPLVIAHPQSFHMYRQYFDSLLSWRIDNRLETIAPIIKNGELAHFLREQSKKHETIDDLIKYRQNKKLCKHQLLLLAFNEINNRTINE